MMKTYGSYGAYGKPANEDELSKKLKDDISSLHNLTRWSGFSPLNPQGSLIRIQETIDKMYEDYVQSNVLVSKPYTTFKISDKHKLDRYLDTIKDCAETMSLMVNRNVDASEWSSLIGDIHYAACQIGVLPIVPKRTEYIIDARSLTDEERAKLYKRLKEAKLTIVTEGDIDV